MRTLTASRFGAAALATALTVITLPAVCGAEEPGIDASTRDAVRRALDDTRAAQGFYTAVITKHGKLDPFVGILEAETRQDKALVALGKAHGMDLADSRQAPASGAEVPATVKDACSAAIDAVKRSVALYDEVIPNVTQSAIRKDLESYREASATRQIPAFERCVARGGGEPAVAGVSAGGCSECGMAGGCGCMQGAEGAARAKAAAAQGKAPGCGCKHQQGK